ncbi:hypothetical protein ACI7YT_09045 [Microbacterium sp. M]|uniref:hypothetical protein n=1 Tax=Microbacterium sp. M TaxID=3377125 RepID=UPI0038677B82
MEFDYGVVILMILSWVLVALVGAAIIYGIVRLAVAHALRAHDKRLNPPVVAATEHAAHPVTTA